MLIALTFDLSERIYLSNKIWTNFATKIDGIYIIHWSWSFWRKFKLNVLFILIVSPNELMIKSVMTYQNIYLISFLNSFSLSFLKKIRKIRKKNLVRVCTIWWLFLRLIDRSRPRPVPASYHSWSKLKRQNEEILAFFLLWFKTLG